MAQPAKFVWMSDLHFDSRGPVEGYDTGARLDAAVDFINAQHGDAGFCIVTGDVVDDASDESYRQVAARLGRLNMPYLPLVGNHDRRALFRQHLALPDHGMTDFIQYRARFDWGRLLCLDTLKPGHAEGAFCATRMAWLRAELDRAKGETVIVAMHHPPLNLNMPVLDPMKLEQGREVTDVLASCGNVRFMLMGHVHRPVAGCVSGIPFAAMRSVLYQAPHSRPAWDLSEFHPAKEAPNIGVGTVAGDTVVIEYVQVCPHDTGYSDKLSFDTRNPRTNR